MKRKTLFITGTGTGAGKTFLATLLTRFLRSRGANVAAFKPVCSGGRGDAVALHAALGGTLTLDEINPWHFRATIAPALAARRERKSVAFSQIVEHVRSRQEGFDVTLVEGAGGLLSPLGKKFDSRDLILALDADPIIVAPNRLGVVNHLLLTLEALPKKFRARAKVVLVSPARPDFAAATNADLLAEYFPAGRIVSLPWFGRGANPATVLKNPRVRRVLEQIFQPRKKSGRRK